MSDFVLRREVLKLNKLHSPVGFTTIKKTFINLANYVMDIHKNEYILDSNNRKIRKYLAYDIEYAQLDNGDYNFDEVVDIRVVDWEEWITLPIRSYDLVIRTARQSIRVPRVIVSMLSDDMPMTKHNTSLKSVYDIYGGT